VSPQAIPSKNLFGLFREIAQRILAATLDLLAEIFSALVTLMKV
jgi:hypothetical protein